MQAKPIPPAIVASLARAAVAFDEFDQQVRALADKPLRAATEPERNVPPRTVEQFLAELAESEISIAEWSRVNGQPAQTVYMLCYGRIRGLRGKARKVAEAMNLVLPPFNAYGASL